MTEGMKLEERREYRHQYYLDHRTEQIEYAKQYNRLHKVIRTKHYWEYRAQLKAEVLTHYGIGNCACVKCGFADIRALSIDHINGNGGQHRQAEGITGGRPFYVWLRKNGFPKGFQTLCMNCQYIKRCEEKEYRTGRAS